MNYFLRYLKFIREKNPGTLSRRTEIIAKVNADFNFNGDASAIIEFLANFPLTIPDYPPFEPILKLTLVRKLHSFVCKEQAIFGEKSLIAYDRLIGNEDDYEYHFKESVVQGLLEEVVRIACLELLDEQGKLYPPIMALFFSDLAIVPEKQKVKFFIASYVNHIILPAMKIAWKLVPRFNEDMREKITSRIMSEIIFASIDKTISLKIQQGTQGKNEEKIKYVIDKLRISDNALRIIHASHISKLEKAIVKQAILIALPEEPASFLDIFKSAEPVSFETALAEMLKAVDTEEFESIQNSACRFTTRTVKALLYHCIDRQLADINLYGKPLALGFHQAEYLGYLRSNSSLEAEENPVNLNNNTHLPFSREMMIDLANYFHYMIMMVCSDVREVKKNKFFKFFVIKIILFSYSQVLGKQGNIKTGVLDLLAEEHEVGDEIQEFQRNVLYNYLRKLLVTLSALWLSDNNYQQEFLTRNPAPSENLLVKIMGVIEKKLEAGLSISRLVRIAGFPAYGNRELAENFAISITCSEDSTGIKDVVETIQGKFHLIAQYKELLTRFGERNQSSIEIIKEMLLKIDVKRQQYKLVMESPSQFFKNVKESLNEYDLESDALQKRLELVEGQVADLTHLYQLMEGSFLSESVEDMEKRGDVFIQLKARFVKTQEDIKAEGERLYSSVNSAYVKGKEIESLQRLHDVRIKYAKREGVLAKKKCDLARERRNFYLKRDKIYPRALTNSIGWGYRLEKEEKVICACFQIIKKECLAIIKICGEIKQSGFKDLAGNEKSEVWRSCMRDSIISIKNHKLKLSHTLKIINDASKPLAILVDGAKARHEEIYNMMSFILGEPEFWKRRVSPFWGGDCYQIDNITYKFPKRAVVMMKAKKFNEVEEENMRERMRKKNKPDADIAQLGFDVKLGNIIHAYNQTTPGYSCWRSNKTSEFYDIIILLDKAAQHNFYEITHLELIKSKLLTFMRNACEPNYQMYARYQNLNRVQLQTQPQPAPSALEQISGAISDAVEAARNNMRL